MWAKLIIALAPIALKIISLLASSRNRGPKTAGVNIGKKLQDVAFEVAKEGHSVDVLPAMITARFRKKYPQFSARVILVLARNWVKIHRSSLA